MNNVDTSSEALASNRDVVAFVDQKVFFKALAFLAVTLKSEAANEAIATQQIQKLTGLLQEFCLDMEKADTAS